MLDGSDKETFFSLRLLRDVVDRRQKPLILWCGAGVSMWCGYPSWKEVAEQFLRAYRRFEPNYDVESGTDLLTCDKFPDLFETFRNTDSQRYNKQLVDTFQTRPITPVYERFLGLVNAIKPIHIITTNVDEMIERNLAAMDVVQRSDFTRCIELLSTGRPFIAKIHGSISAIESTVFSSRDYQGLIDDASYIDTLRVLLVQSTVVFIGYSLRDEYVLKLFLSNADLQNLFGDGPHFVLHCDETPNLPSSVHTIRYAPTPYSDHRSALTVLDIIRVVEGNGPKWFWPESKNQEPRNVFISACFLSDVVPPGTWTSTYSLVLAKEEGQAAPNAIVGQGFDNSELSEQLPPAMHDLTVSLLCFDYVYAPVLCVGRLHELLGSENFWQVVRAGILRFVWLEQEPVVMFRSVDDVNGGDIGTVLVSTADRNPVTAESRIRDQIKPTPGHEAEAETLIEGLLASVVVFDHTRFNTPSLTRGALLHPAVQELLGISDAILPTSFPRWVTFPVLRLAHTIVAACVCEHFAIPATKLAFGGETLAGAAFAVSAARDWADSVGSYVLSGRFNTNLGQYVQSDPYAIPAILDFRNSNTGSEFRRQILQQLATQPGAEFVASIDAGLRQVIPTAVMDEARDQLSGLLLRSNNTANIVPAVWTNIRNTDAITRKWRRRSLRELEKYCRTYGIRESSFCPCGSREKLRNCCAKALRP